MPDRRCFCYAASLPFTLITASLLAPNFAHGQPPVDPDVAANFVITNNWMTGLQRPTDIAFLADGRAVVTLRNGAVVVRRANGTLNNPAYVFANTDSDSEKGLLGVSALRSWRSVSDGSEAQRTVFFFVSNGPTSGDKHRVYRGVVQANDTVTVDLANPIVSMNLEGPANHDGGTVQVHGDYIFVSVGDTGANSPNPQNKYGNCLNKPNGKILRVRLDGSIPADNPLANVAQVTSCQTPTGAWGMAPPDRRIFAWGFRNPFRIWVDPLTGLVWAGDVGEENREEISVVRRGDNLGFPFFEGTRKNPRNLGAVNDCTDVTPSGPCVGPIYEYPRGENDNRAVIGGLIPDEDGRLCGWPETYKGRYFFGDYNGGRIFTMEVNRAQGTMVPNSVREFARSGNVTTFKVGFDDALYVVRHVDNNGGIVRIAARNRDAMACANNTMNTGGAGGSAQGGAGGSAQGGAGGSAQGGAGGSAQGGAGGSAQGGAGGMTGEGGAAQGGQSGSTGGETGTGGAGEGGDGPVDSGDGGCTCRVGGATDGAGSLFVIGLAVSWLGIARRRRRQRGLR